MEDIALKNFSDFEFDKISPKDPRYAICFFKDVLQGKLVQADFFVESIYKTILKETSTAAQIVDCFKEGSRFVVDMPDSVKKAIDEGRLKLVVEHGKLKAQLIDKNGHYSKKLDIKEEFFREGIDPVKMSNALQMKALQEQLQQVADQIVVINSNVLDVLQGQQNDRIALFYSGVNLYLEAQSIRDPEIKSALIAQSIRALSEGTQQLVLALEADIDFLLTKGYEKFRGKKVQTIQSKMDSINKSFGFIHQATLVRAAIYCDQDEYMAMANVLNEYSRFIETTIVANANLLSQCDPNDNGTDSGLWRSRASLKLDIDEIRKALSSNKQEYYLSLEVNNNEG